MILALATLFLLGSEAIVLDGASILSKTQAYHDPEGTWMHRGVELRIETGYADGRTSVRLARVDNRNAHYEDRFERDGKAIEQFVEGDECRFVVDGVPISDSGNLEELELSCDDAKRRRDYISYLWGLPMKLSDPGTRIDASAVSKEFQGHEVFDLVVRYDPEVGTDVWHMYVEPNSGRLLGYAFYKSPQEERGEYIVLEDEIAFGNYRIPAKRHWYAIPGDEFLGTDTLLSAEVLP